MNRTDIQWTWTQNPDGTWTKGSTWNPLKGCRRVSPGCGGVSGTCYAERLIATRLRNLPMYEGLARMTSNGPQFTGEHRMDLGVMFDPIRTHEPRRIFVCDMGDLFFEGHTFDEIAAVFGVMVSAPRHTFQVLTKRPKRMAEFFSWLDKQAPAALKGWIDTVADAETACGEPIGTRGAHESSGHRIALHNAAASVRRTVKDRPQLHVPFYPHFGWPAPNVWIGVTAEDRKRWAERVPILRTIPAAVHFVSVEPQMEDLRAVDLAGIQWVIQGGWSGPGAGSFDVAWMRSMQAQCKSADVAWFPKQVGPHPTVSCADLAELHPAIPLSDGQATVTVGMHDSHGGDESEWPADLRGCRAFPEAPRG